MIFQYLAGLHSLFKGDINKCLNKKLYKYLSGLHIFKGD